jgi:hypothetical protein
MARFRNFLQEKLGTKEEEDPVEAEIRKHQKQEEDAEKDESKLKLVLELVRALFFEHKLVGSITVSKTMGVLTRTLSCEIDGTELSTNDGDNGGPQESLTSDRDQLSRVEKLIMSAVTASIDGMIGRARAYKSKSYRKDLSLSNSVSVSDPFFGIVGMYVCCTATAESLLRADVERTLLKMES